MAKQVNQKQSEDSAEKKERTSLYLLPSIQKKVKYICLKDGGFQNDVFEAAISDYVEKWEKKNGEITI